MARQRLPASERRRQIVEATLKILANDGPRALTLVRIGEAVGIADASVLGHFADKDAIVSAAIDRFGELLREDVPDDVIDPIERIGVFFVRRAEKIRSRPELMVLAHDARLREVATPSGVEQIDAHVAHSAQFIRQALLDGVAQGRIRNDVPVAMWLWLVVGAIRGFAGHVPRQLRDGPTEGLEANDAWIALRALMSR